MSNDNVVFLRAVRDATDTLYQALLDWDDANSREPRSADDVLRCVKTAQNCAQALLPRIGPELARLLPADGCPDPWLWCWSFRSDVRDIAGGCIVPQDKCRAVRERYDALDEWVEYPLCPDAPYNPFRDLLHLCPRIHQEVEFNLFTLIGKDCHQEDWNEWGPRKLAREEQLQALADDCLRAAARTGFPVADVERRVRALFDPVRAILDWRMGMHAIRQERWNVGTWHEPIERYLHENYKRAQDAEQDVRTLAVLADPPPTKRPDQMHLLDEMARGFAEVERDVALGRKDTNAPASQAAAQTAPPSSACSPSGEMTARPDRPALSESMRESMQNLCSTVARDEARARYWYRRLTGYDGPVVRMTPAEEERLRALFGRVKGMDQREIDSEIAKAKVEQEEHSRMHCFGPDWLFLDETLAEHCGLTPEQVGDMTMAETADALRAAYLRLHPHALAAEPTPPAPIRQPEGQTARPDGVDGGCWLWWQGERHDIPKGVVYRLIGYMWDKDSARYDKLDDDVFDGPIQPDSLRARVSEVNKVLKKIGLPWRLKTDSTSRILTKQRAT